MSEMARATGAQVRRQAPNYFEDWHTAPRRQYVVTLRQSELMLMENFR
jgi:hypothetical protein